VSAEMIIHVASGCAEGRRDTGYPSPSSLLLSASHTSMLVRGFGVTAVTMRTRAAAAVAVDGARPTCLLLLRRRASSAAGTPWHGARWSQRLAVKRVADVGTMQGT
jgi:hypothetical protein